jgi:hypothetical protein
VYKLSIRDYFLCKYPATATRPNSDTNATAQYETGIAAMRWHTRSASSSSSASNIEDIIRLIAPPARDAFGEMLEYELRGRGELPADEVRRIAEQTWKRFLKEGWPRS